MVSSLLILHTLKQLQEVEIGAIVIHLLSTGPEVAAAKVDLPQACSHRCRIVLLLGFERLQINCSARRREADPLELEHERRALTLVPRGRKCRGSRLRHGGRG